MEKGSLLSVCVCVFCWCQVGVYTSNAVGLCINRRLDTQFKRRYSCRLLYTADKHLMLSPTQCCVCASLHFLCRCSQLLSDQRHYLKRAINKRSVITGSGLAPPARPPGLRGRLCCWHKQCEDYVQHRHQEGFWLTWAVGVNLGSPGAEFSSNRLMQAVISSLRLTYIYCTYTRNNGETETGGSLGCAISSSSRCLWDGGAVSFHQRRISEEKTAAERAGLRRRFYIYKRETTGYF